jgi:predicted DNA-binding transcriptional regulator AlpA
MNPERSQLGQLTAEWLDRKRSEKMKLLTTKSVSEMLAVPEGTVRYWRKAGVGPPWVKLEGSIRYVEQEVLRYIESNRRTPSVRAYVEEKDVV